MVKTKAAAEKREPSGAARVRASLFLEAEVYQALRMYATSKNITLGAAGNEIVTEGLVWAKWLEISKR